MRCRALLAAAGLLAAAVPAVASATWRAEPVSAAAVDPVAAIAATGTGAGYWLIDQRGGVSAFGDAPELADLAAPLNAPVVAMTATPSGDGAWAVASDGGVFTFGDAPYLGGLGATPLNQPIVAMAATPSGEGYWLFAADGGVFTFGDAAFAGSLGAIPLNRPIVGAAADGRTGYWLVAADGGVFTFGGATFAGAEPDAAQPVVGMAVRPDGRGYWVATRAGAVRAFGTAPPAEPLPPRPLDDVRLRTEVVVDGLSAPTAVTTRPGDRTLYVTERAGRVRAVRDGRLLAEPVLALPDGLLRAGGERGLLGLAFDAAGRHLTIHHTLPDGDVAVAEYAVTGPDAGPVRADPSSRRELLRIEHSAFGNHNGGDVHLGPDGYLYVTVGDGGGAGDPLGSGQDPHSLLGTVLRIDPSRPSAGRPYGIPPDNPFADGRDGAPEVWAWGLRNPWRIAFDRVTGDLWIADVGQARLEEVNLEPAGTPGGRNYGWSRFEGSQPFGDGPVPADHVPPLFEYAHDGGDLSITGGRVYRGRAVPGLAGAYLYGDFGSGRVGALRQRDGVVVEAVDRLATVEQVVAFGEDADGELVALSLGGRLVRFVAG